MAGDLCIGNSGKVLSGGCRKMSILFTSFSLLFLSFRVIVASVARMDLQGKEGSKVEWDCRGRKVMEGQKDNP